MARHQRIAKLFDEDFWVTRWRSQAMPGGNALLHDVFVMDADLLQQYGIGMKEAFVMEDLVANE